MTLFAVKESRQAAAEADEGAGNVEGGTAVDVCSLEVDGPKYCCLNDLFCSLSWILTVSDRMFIFLERSLFCVSRSMILVLDITISCFRSLISASYWVVGGVPPFFFFCFTFAAADRDITKAEAEGSKLDVAVGDVELPGEV